MVSSSNTDDVLSRSSLNLVHSYTVRIVFNYGTPLSPGFSSTSSINADERINDGGCDNEDDNEREAYKQSIDNILSAIVGLEVSRIYSRIRSFLILIVSGYFNVAALFFLTVL